MIVISPPVISYNQRLIYVLEMVSLTFCILLKYWNTTMPCSECDATYFNIGRGFDCFHCAFIALSLLRLVFFLNFFALFLEQMNKICNKCKNGSLKKAFTTLLKKLCLKQTTTMQKKMLEKINGTLSEAFKTSLLDGRVDCLRIMLFSSVDK